MTEQKNELAKGIEKVIKDVGGEAWTMEEKDYKSTLTYLSPKVRNYIALAIADHFKKNLKQYVEIDKVEIKENIMSFWSAKDNDDFPTLLTNVISDTKPIKIKQEVIKK